MHLSLLRFYWLRLIGAVSALVFALLYLGGREIPALGGFTVIAFIAIYITVRVNMGNMPAVCDLCGNKSIMTAEYGAGFTNARLIITCKHCGRVVNGKPGSVLPRKESS